MIPGRFRKSPILSPLRYPGAKRRLVGYVSQALLLNDKKPTLLVEPFAGSASVTLQLLQANKVERALIGEKDPWVAAFWKTAFFDSEWLIHRVETTTPTLEMWNQLKRTKGKSLRHMAFTCLFLNRTSFSGILAAHAGAIGGQKQNSAYSIECRFPVKALTRRLEQAAEFKDRIEGVMCADWRKTIRKAQQSKDSKSAFYYLDPPFYHKASRLYRYYFDHQGHDALCNFLKTFDAPWLLSYDSAPEVMKLYKDHGITPKAIDLLYSTKGSTGMKPATELIMSNLPVLPANGRVWKSKAEWLASRSSRAPLVEALPPAPGLAI